MTEQKLPLPTVPRKWGNMSTKELKKATSDFQLHCALIMHQENLSKAKAQFVAWLEGEDGLEDRLSGK